MKRYLHTHFPSSTVHKRQEEEATQVSIDREMNKQNAVYTCNGILFILKKEENSDTFYNVNESWGHYAKWNKQVTKRKILYDSIYMKYVETSNSYQQKLDWWLLGPGGRMKWGAVF